MAVRIRRKLLATTSWLIVPHMSYGNFESIMIRVGVALGCLDPRIYQKK